MLKSIEIENFKGIKSLKAEDFGQVNLIAGKNNSCKTSLLEAIYLATNPYNELSYSTIFSNRRFNINITNNDVRLASNEIKWKSLFYLANIELNPKIIITIDNYTREILYSKNTLNTFANFIGDKSLLQGLKADSNGNKFEVLDFYDLSGNYSSNLNPIKIPSVDETTTQAIIEDLNKYSPAKFFANSNIFFTSIFAENFGKLSKNQAKSIIEILKTIEPKLEDISLGANNAFRCDLGVEQYLPINVMGDGFLKIFIYAILAVSNTNGMVLFDEIENGLHYTSLKTMWKAIFTVSKACNTQIFATTHSIECIEAFNAAYEEMQDSFDIRYYRLNKDEENNVKATIYEEDILEAAVKNNIEVR